jgi:hypothetical protein
MTRSQTRAATIRDRCTNLHRLGPGHERGGTRGTDGAPKQCLPGVLAPGGMRRGPPRYDAPRSCQGGESGPRPPLPPGADGRSGTRDGYTRSVGRLPSSRNGRIHAPRARATTVRAPRRRLRGAGEAPHSRAQAPRPRGVGRASGRAVVTRTLRARRPRAPSLLEPAGRVDPRRGFGFSTARVPSSSPRGRDPVRSCPPTGCVRTMDINSAQPGVIRGVRRPAVRRRYYGSPSCE